jgi:cytidine deaminase
LSARRPRKETPPGAARLLREADTARGRAYAPYSHFRVGAALLTASGRIVTACNVENASLGLSICAERAAVFRAIAEGEREFVAIGVSAGPKAEAAPCGACRQVLHEFAPGIVVYWRNRNGRAMKRTLAGLLPESFELRRRRR